MTFTELSKWLDQGSKVLKATSDYLLECQVEVNSQIFKAHYRNVVKGRAEVPKHTTMLNMLNLNFSSSMEDQT
jgi:hypothetical protein